ncbi:hypothetical protein SAY86_029906 [Trapa natans]|uniref:Uncharacterized protein n=1 Tax=Trapa natans TaxID=22666 RepID=A0AAN7M213_TRANT|nr:hypothetical protein SAY86_029906 [Trapa natans]
MMAEAEIANLVSNLGEQKTPFSPEAPSRSNCAVKPILEDLRLKKEERMKEFVDTLLQIAKICAEIAGNNGMLINPIVSWLIRLQKVNCHIHTIHEFFVVMWFDFLETVNKIHPSLTGRTRGQSKFMSKDTLASLLCMINSLKQEKEQRLCNLQNLGSKLIELRDLMDIPAEEQKFFYQVTILISSSIDEVSRGGSIAIEVFQQVELEVERLNVLKASKTKELVMKRQRELEEMHKGGHMDLDGDSTRNILVSFIDSGNVDLSELLDIMDHRFVKAKEQASSGRDILDRVEKWERASEEEKWLDDYEKVPLMHTLEECMTQRQEKDHVKRRLGEQKRLQEQLTTEQEATYGSRSSSAKKPLNLSINTNNLPGTHPSVLEGQPPGAMDSPSSQAERTVPEPTP